MRLRANVLLFLLLVCCSVVTNSIVCDAAMPLHSIAKSTKQQQSGKNKLVTNIKQNLSFPFANPTDRHHSYHGYSANNKSGVWGVLSFVSSMLALFSLVAAALVLYLALPTSLATLFLFTIPRATYFYLALTSIFSSAALIMGLMGIKRKHSGLAIAGFILGSILLIAAITILSNI